MKISDSFLIHAPPEKVWNFFLDIERMSRCVPGVEAVEALDDKTYRGKLKVKVGPIGATFGGVARLTELDPPRRLVASVAGDANPSASAAKAVFVATLVAVEGGTEVSYQMDVTLRGRGAQFGGPVIGATAKKMTAEFVKNVEIAVSHA